MPKVSVIVNTVDRPQDLDACLVSVLDQTFKDFEIIIVNNGTGEETNEVLEKFKNRFAERGVSLTVVNDQTKKLSYLFNLGWRSANPNSQYLAYLADDMEAGKDWLAEAVFYLDQFPESGGISGPTLSLSDPPGEMFHLRDLARRNFLTKIILRIYEYFVMEDKTLEPGYWPESGAFSMGAGIPLPQIVRPIEIDLLTSGNMVVRRSALETVKGFDENFYFNHADGDLFIRLKKAGFKLIFHPQVSARHHMRFGPTRYPWILGRDTGFYYLKDVRPRSLRGWLGAFINLFVFNGYFVFKALELRRVSYLKGISGFFRGVVDFFLRASSERNDLLGKFLVLASFLALFANAYRNLWHYNMLAYGDTVPFPQSLSQAWQSLTAGWDYRSPGTLIVPQIIVLYSLLPVEIFLMILSGGNPVIAQRIYHYLPMPLAFVAMYFFVSRLISSKLARFFAAFVYSANLFMVAEFLGGFEGNLYIQAFLPWLLILLYRIYRQQKFWASLFSYTLLLSLAYILSDHVFLFLVPFFLLFLILSGKESHREKNLRPVKRFLIFLIISHSLIFLTTLYHSFYYLKVSLPFLFGEKIPVNVLLFLKSNVDDTYRFYTLGNSLRTGGAYFINLFSGSQFWTKSGFVLPLLAFSWIFFPANWRKPKVKIGLFFTLLAASDLLFINFARGERLSWLFRDLPILFRFRNPSRPSLFLLFCYAILIALSLEGLIRKIRSLLAEKGKIALGSVFFLIIILVTTAYYFRPFFSGDLTMGKNRGAGAEITSPYYQLGDWLAARHREEGFFRTLFVPWDHENAEVKLYWLEPLTLSVPINYGAYLPRSEYLVSLKKLFKNLVDGEDVNYGRNLAEAGVKYLVVNGNSKDRGPAIATFDYQTPWLFGAADNYRRLIENYPDFRYETTLSGFRIYRNLKFDRTVIDPVKSGQPDLPLIFLWRRQRVLLSLSAVSFLLVCLSLVYAKKRLL